MGQVYPIQIVHDIGGSNCPNLYTEYLSCQPRRNQKINLAQELGIEEQPEVIQPCSKAVESQVTRDRTQAYADWRDLVEAQIAKEYVPDNLAQEVFDEINDNRRLTDGYTCPDQ